MGQLGYNGYGEFLQALRDFVDSGLTLPDRVDLPGMKGPGTDLLHRVVFEEMNNLRQFYEAIDMKMLDRIVDQLHDSPAVYVVGSRVSYTFAYYLGWSLTKVRKGVNILKGSDSTTIEVISKRPAMRAMPRDRVRFAVMAIALIAALKQKEWLWSTPVACARRVAESRPGQVPSCWPCSDR